MYLWGREVRLAALAVLLQAGRPLEVPEVLRRIEAKGYVVRSSYPLKRVADALGHEVARGRAARVRRGVYEVGRIAKTTRWRILNRYGGSAPRTLEV